MDATARILRGSEPLGHGLCHEVFPSSTSPAAACRPRMVMCLKKAARMSTNNPAGGARKPASRTPACVLVSEPKTDKGFELGLVLADKILFPWMKFIKEHGTWRLNIQTLIEKVIIDCRFFTLLAIAGSLVGSALCFLEGCVLTVDSYFHYFHSMSRIPEPIHVVPILIEAIDMFLVGSAMFTFGMALHTMFVGQQNIKAIGSTFSRNFNLQKLPAWIGMESPIQAKSKIGHAVMMILQVQVLEKFKSIPVTNGIDLACSAGALFLSSASIFILSRTVAARTENRIQAATHNKSTTAPKF